MIEKNLIINSRELRYEGLFKADDLFRVINLALDERGYHKREKKSEEIVTELGRKFVLELRPYAEATSFITKTIKIRIMLDNVTDAKAAKEAPANFLQQGTIKIIFDAYLLTEYEHSWEMQPWVFFVKQFVDKFIYPSKVSGRFGGELVADTAYIYAKIKKHLASYGKEEPQRVSEEKIRKDAEADILAEMEKEPMPQ